MKAVTGIILTCVIGAMFLSFFHMSSGMNMTGGMSDCMFMVHHEVVCPMDFAEHVGAWKSAFQAIIPTLTLFFGLSMTVTLLASTAPNLFFKFKSLYIPIVLHQIRERTYTYTHRKLQEFFAKGILHPKTY